jgi:peptidyl-tRNA hydrolase
MLRIYAIIRGDLEMTPGKLASQACHAAKNCSIIAAKNDPAILRLYQGPDFIGTQIILKAKNEMALMLAYEKAQQAGLITSLIIDKGHVMLPHFDGSPIVTALGIGPCTKEQANKITKRFELVK